MLARTVGPKFNHYPCFVQPKLNGVRALFQQHQYGTGNVQIELPYGTFQSRDEKLWNQAVLKHLTNELSTINLNNVILDGELYRHGWRLQRINGAVAVNRSQPRDDTHKVCFHVFDVVDPQRKFSNRFLNVFNQIKNAQLPHIVPVETAFASSWNEVELFFHHWIRLGYEGIMLRPDEVYEFGEHLGRNGTITEFRSRNLWKHKQWEDAEFRCVGFTEGKGKAEIGAGALILTLDWNAPFHGGPDKLFKVGTGLTDEDRIWFAQSPPIGQMIKVRYLCLTAGGIPFNPSFMCVMS